MKEKIISGCSIIILTIYPCFFLYFQNVSECNVSEIASAVLILLAIAAICALVLFAVIRDFEKAILIDNLLMLVFLNFSLIESLFQKVFKSIYYWHVAIILVFIVIWCGALIKILLSAEDARMANLVVTIVFGALTVFNGVLAIPYIAAKLSAEAEKSRVEISSVEKQTLPNFYFMIFDAYGGIENLEHYFDYDNSDFYSEMEDLGFNISLGSYNENYYTGVVMTNLLNLDYVGEYTGDVKTTDWTLFSELRKNPVLYQLLLKAGYNLNIVDAENFLDATSSTYQFEGAFENIELSAPYMIFNRTALYPLYQRRTGKEEVNVLNDIFEYQKMSPSLQDSNLCTMFYICSPHDPWYVDENGHPLNATDRFKWENPDLYLGQMKYLNKKIKETVTSIIRQDPNCVILIQSDHGWRLPIIIPERYPNFEQEIPYMRNIINLLYYQGENVNIEGETGINTLRLILNNLIGLDLPWLDPSEYKGK